MRTAMRTAYASALLLGGADAVGRDAGTLPVLNLVPLPPVPTMLPTGTGRSTDRILRHDRGPEYRYPDTRFFKKTIFSILYDKLLYFAR